MPASDYNVAPTTHQPIIRQSREIGEREMVLRWLVRLFKGMPRLRLASIGGGLL